MRYMIALALVILAGCQNQPQPSALDSWQPPQVKLQPVIAGGKPLKSDQLMPSAHQPAMLPPIQKLPQGVEKPEVKLIVVRLADHSDQRLYTYGEDKETPLASYPVSGAAGPSFDVSYKGKLPEIHNHPGTFYIDRKEVMHISGTYNCPMPYALHYFEGHYIHATEPKFFNLLGQPASHGCIRENMDNAKWLFSHTPIGCKLVIE